MRISEFSKKTKLTKRALQYYDEVGVLKPKKLSNGYRTYSDEDLKLVEVIKFLQELDYTLLEIKELTQTDLNKNELITTHISYLKDKIILIEEDIKRLTLMKEGIIMEKAVDYLKEEYKAEVEERWGTTDEFIESKKTKHYTKSDWDRIKSHQNDIFIRLSKEEDITTNTVKALVQEWQDFITSNFYSCSDKVLLSLAEMYVTDERFMKNLDKIADGFSKHLSDSIKYHRAQ